MWDLMMKNVYYLNSFGISREEFRFEIWYLDQEAGVELPFIAEGPIDGKLLLQVMELDNLDYYNGKHDDGEFDYITPYNPYNYFNRYPGTKYYAKYQC